MARHNDLRDGVAELAGKAFTPTHVGHYPLIFLCFAMKRPMAKPSRSKAISATPQLDATEQKGNLLICDLYHNGTDSVHDMHVMNTDAKYHSEKTP